jgi:hypothetical protein
MRPAKDENGRYIFAVRKNCLGSGCDREFKTKDPTQPFCRNCRRKKDKEDPDLF